MATDVDDGAGGEASSGGGCRLAPRLNPAARQDAPVGATKVGVAQRVAERVHRAVNVAQPVAYTQNKLLHYSQRTVALMDAVLPNNCPYRDPGPHSACFLEPSRVHIPNGISIATAVLAQLMGL